MSAATPFALLANGASMPWAKVPARLVADFVRTTSSELSRGARLCAWFGLPDGAGTRLVAVLAFDADNTLAVGRSEAFTGGYPALTVTHPQAHLFEREVWEQHGVTPEGHPWLKPVRKTNARGNAPAHAEFFRVDGREVHEVAVGPVHAGIIEPGHFRFQCAGEEVLHLEIALGYQHPKLAAKSTLEVIPFSSQLPAGRYTVRADAIGAEIVNVSHHLGVLRGSGLVRDKKIGRYVFYTLNPDVISKNGTALLFHLAGCTLVID